MNRLNSQIQFLVEIDKLKTILRQTQIIGEARPENDAEHSWHLAMMAIVLHEYAPSPINLLRVVKMVLVHDIVEIDAGDTFVYDAQGALDKAEREERAAARLFPLLPPDQAAEILALWQEFEARATPEARFAAAVDRLNPMLLNFHTSGAAWARHGITSDRVLRVNSIIEDGAPALWEYAQALVKEAVAEGFLAEPTAE